MNFVIQNFSGGLNTLFDPRILGPNKSGDTAESPDMENMDLTALGAIVTSTGISQVSTIVATGGTKNIMTYAKDASTRYLIIAHDDDYYSITPSSSTWSSIGDYGTAATNVGGVVYKGTSSIRRAILGNDTSANTTQKWDGTTFGAVGGSPPDGWIMEEWMGRLFLASGSSVYYTDVEDEDDWAGGGVISFNDIVTGLIAQGDFLIVYTRDEAYAVQMYYNDSFSLSVPLKKPFKNSSGCLAHKTAQRVYNDIYALSVDGVQRFGADAQFIGQNLRVNSLSWKINPSITGTALNGSQVERACGVYFKKKYYMAVPLASDPVNSTVFVYNYDYDSWTKRTGIYASAFAVMADSNNDDELYFGHNTVPELYKFVDSFDYNGSGYTRSYTTKTFTMGNPMASKFWQYIDIKGSKFLGTKFKVDMIVDGVTKTYEINDDCLESNPTGGYYGDSYLGDIYFGGAFGSQFKRYGARLPFPYEIRTGRELVLKFYNSASGQPWSVDYVDIAFNAEAPVKIPTIYNNATLIS